MFGNRCGVERLALTGGNRHPISAMISNIKEKLRTRELLSKYVKLNWEMRIFIGMRLLHFAV